MITSPPTKPLTITPTARPPIDLSVGDVGPARAHSQRMSNNLITISNIYLTVNHEYFLKSRALIQQSL